MDPRCAFYSLTPPWQMTERKLLVRAVDAIRLASEGGHEKVPADDLEPALASAARRDRANLCAFIQRSGLARASLSSLDEHGLVQLVRDSLRCGDLTVLREYAVVPDGPGNSLPAQRRLVVAIRKALPHPLSHEGRRYALVAGADLAGMPTRDSYEVVGRKDALAVLDRIGRTEHGLAALLAEAGERLTQDWRPPFSPDGLVLLRAVIQPRFVEATPDAKGWRPSRPKKSVFNPSGSPEPEQPEVDPARQAATYVNASRDGVPFCEECARARLSAGS